MMVNFLFKMFSKEYCSSERIGHPIIHEVIFPYENINLGSYVKGAAYVRKAKWFYKFNSPFLKGDYRTEYSGVLFIKISDIADNVTEKTIKLKTKEFNSDHEFLIDLYRNYEI